MSNDEGPGLDLGSNLDSAPATTKRKKAPVGMPESSWIVLEENDDIPPTGLFVGHNGNGFLIRAGEPVLVPNHVISILDDAIMSSPQIDPSSKRVIGYRERRRYPYRRVDAPTGSE